MILNDRYLIQEQIQKSSWINVYVVEDQLTSKLYIAKEVLKEANPILIHQFHVEVDVLSQLEHKHFPSIIDVFETRNSMILIETYFKGIDLGQWLLKHDKISQKLKKKWILDCIDMLQHIHKKGFLYIDLKPENLIIVDEEIYLIDFNACLEKTSHQAILASKVNMAPEFLETGYLDQTSDIYGMGGILLALYSRGPCRKLAQKCRDTLPSKRIRSMKQLKRCFLLCCRAKYILSIIICILLSVFLFSLLFRYTLATPLSKYLDTKNSSDLISAYQFTLNQAEGTYQQKVQDTLYLWIDNGWISTSALEDEKVARFLLKQAIQSQNISWCSYILNLLNDDVKDQLIDLVLLTNVYIEQTQNIQYEHIHRFLNDLKTKTLSTSQKMENMFLILNVINECEIILKQQDLDILYKLQSNLSDQQNEILRSLANAYLSYGLIIQDEDLEFKIPSFYTELFKDDLEKLEIIQFLGG